MIRSQQEGGIETVAVGVQHIELAVAVEICDGYVDGAVAIVEYVREETRLVPVSRLIFQVEDFAGVAPAENSHDQIEFAFTAEIRVSVVVACLDGKPLTAPRPLPCSDTLLWPGAPAHTEDRCGGRFATNAGLLRAGRCGGGVAPSRSVGPDHVVF